MRPTKPCARCTRHLLPNCEHLANTYDKFFLKDSTRTEQDLIEYALNRILALDRDNGNKAEGAPASRIYKSRNTKTSDAMAGRCGAPLINGPGSNVFHCIRNKGHEGEHKW